jgi:hypothetical protein
MEYNTYFEEMIILEATICNFQQITYRKYNPQSSEFQFREMITLDPTYSTDRSLLYGAETEEFVDFVDGKPTVLNKYYFIVVLGSSKVITEPTGLAPIAEGGLVDFNKCNFYVDYFYNHPADITPIQCKQNDLFCDAKNNLSSKKWCNKCHGIFSAKKLSYLLRPQIKICEIPRNSVIYVDKVSNIINYDDPNSLVKIKNFLHKDKLKIDSILERINNINTRMEQIIGAMEIDKKFSKEKITKLLSVRGGSMEEYCKTIEEINIKIDNPS